LRAIRIFPALVVETTLSALILGPIFTTLPLGVYFSDASFRHYFLNITGNIHYLLPGVFSNNPLPRTVNYQLWTIPFELQSYIAAAFLATFGLHRKRALFLAAVVFLQLVFVGKSLFSGGIPENVSGKILVLCFLFGMTLYLFREKVPWHPLLALACLGVDAVLFYIPVGGYFVSLPAAYLTVYLGLLNPRKIGLLNTGDYSYGIYLYGFAIQQAVAAFMPHAHNWAISLLMAGPVIAGVAFLSWHCVEKHALHARKLLPKIESVVIPLLVFVERSSAQPSGLTPVRSPAAPEPERGSSGQQ
jgi:peptidoglycan/LPS O-acetylase OafA/YrhL